MLDLNMPCHQTTTGLVFFFLDICAPASDGEQKTDDSRAGGLHWCCSWISVLCNEKVKIPLQFTFAVTTRQQSACMHWRDGIITSLSSLSGRVCLLSEHVKILYKQIQALYDCPCACLTYKHHRIAYVRPLLLSCIIEFMVTLKVIQKLLKHTIRGLG